MNKQANLYGLINTIPGDGTEKLVAYFRGEGYSRYGYDGDLRNLTPEECAIKWLREFDAFLKGSPVGNAAHVRWLYEQTPAGAHEVAEARKSPNMCDALWCLPLRPTDTVRCPLCGWLKSAHV